MVLLVFPERILFLMAHVYELCQIKFPHEVTSLSKSNTFRDCNIFERGSNVWL